MTGGLVFARVVCVLTGLYYSSLGALLFFFPHTFWSRIGPIGPFNQHYARDVGSFLLPLGAILFVAAFDPRRFRTVIAFAALGSTLHAISHLLDGVRSSRDLVSNIGLAAIAGLLAAIIPMCKGGEE